MRTRGVQKASNLVRTWLFVLHFVKGLELIRLVVQRVFVPSHRLWSTRAKRVKTVIGSHEKFGHVQSQWELMRVDESAWGPCKFQAKQEWEFQLSSTLIFVWPGLIAACQDFGKKMYNISLNLDASFWWLVKLLSEPSCPLKLEVSLIVWECK